LLRGVTTAFRGAENRVISSSRGRLKAVAWDNGHAAKLHEKKRVGAVMMREGGFWGGVELGRTGGHSWRGIPGGELRTRRVGGCGFGSEEEQF